MGVNEGLDSSAAGERSVIGYCEHDDISDTIHFGKFSDNLSDQYLMN
jgi:hypothetical protein